MVSSLAIDFTGPFGLLGNHERILFEEPIKEHSGVYIWTARMKEAFIVEYIGMTTKSFGRRHFQHIISTFGGDYRICDAQMMKKGHEVVIWPGFCRNKDGLSEFSERYLELAPSILHYLQTIEVFTAIIKDEGRIIERIEGSLAHHVWSQPPPASALLPKDIRFRARRNNEKPIHISIRCDKGILGIPNEIEV